VRKRIKAEMLAAVPPDLTDYSLKKNQWRFAGKMYDACMVHYVGLAEWLRKQSRGG